MESSTNRSYRIRTKVGDNDGVVKIDMPLVQSYDMFEILSLKLTQKNQYKYYDSSYGVIVGRVLANDNFGIPNARVSIFIPVDNNADLNERILYNFASVQDTNFDNVRYNLLPDYVDSACHQDVGTFPNKRLVLDNNDVIEIFDKYYKYTTVTNQSGDYMLFGVPTGSQTIHVDLDMSDIGVLSQRPRDMVYKGYNINQFDSPNKFKSSTNLNSLSQIYTQDKGIYCYPYWGNSNSDNGNIAITRCDVQIDYKFEPTAIFIGSIITDKGSNAIGKNCTGTDTLGKMSDLSTGEGKIEMIRKTIDNKVEQFQIKGDRLIDGDGVWCYQIPMNLDYVMTDEFGNMVPTDDPSKGIPTRTRVRFRMSLDESPDDVAAHKRCKFLVPNNPRYDKDEFPEFYKTKEADYEFGSATRDESYCDLFWNNVYTVKSYIPRLQKNRNITNRKHTGIKMINHYGDNNPMPYNGLTIKLSFTFRLICILVKVLVWIIATINQIFAYILTPICLIAQAFLAIANGLCFSIFGIKPLCWLGAPFRLLGNLFEMMIVPGITLNSEFCDDGINKIAFYPVFEKATISCVLNKIKKDHGNKYKDTTNVEEVEDWKVLTVTSMTNNEFITCVENQLAQANDATSFNFQNDWVNGILYAPLWYRHITKKKSFLFGLFKKRAKDQWCKDDGRYNLIVFQNCALNKGIGGSYNSPYDGENITEPGSVTTNCGSKCHESTTFQSVNGGLILTRQTMLDQTVYYYKAIEYNRNLGLSNGHKEDGIILLFATDIVLLGSLNDCDMNGIPQFFRRLSPTTYNMPTDILFVDTTVAVNADGTILVEEDGTIPMTRQTEATGADWGNLNSYDECGKMGKDTDSGLFYGIGCSTIELEQKSCLNLSRVCEYGVELDASKDVHDVSSGSLLYETLTPDGFISYDELYDNDGRSMFATLNGNKLRTRLSKKNGLREYDLRHLYIDNFDGLSKQFMRKSGDCNYVKNYNLETFCRDYYIFRMGTNPYYYDNNMAFPRYENSFYFYFGLKMGKTAIDKFNSQFFAECEDTNAIMLPVKIETQAPSFCDDVETKSEGYIKLDMSGISLPCDILINSIDKINVSYSFDNVNDEFVYIGPYKDESDERKDDEGNSDGYKQIATTDVNDISENIPFFELDFGEYDLIITDADGGIIETKINIEGKTLFYSYQVVDNEIPNNQRLSEYAGNKYNTLLGEIRNKYEDFGGYIIISYIDNNDNTETTYEISVQPHNENDIIDFDNIINDDYLNRNGKCEVNVLNDGTFDNFISRNPSYVFEIIDNKLYIFVPKGGIDYDVTVSQMCDGIPSESNTVTNSIRVKDTLPYKLFINEVDVTVFKTDKFNNIGWNNISTTTTLNPNIDKLIEPVNLTGWLNLTNRNNYEFDNLEEVEKAKSEFDEIVETYKELKTQYNIAVDDGKVIFEEQLRTIITQINNAFRDGYKINDDIENDDIESLITKIDAIINTMNYDNLEEVEKAKSEFIQLVKDTFWITCSTSPKDIVISVSTKKKPVDYYLLYNQEMTDNSTSTYKNKLSDNGGKYEDIDTQVYYVDNILMPTISTVDDEDYGYNGTLSGVKNGNVCFAYDNSEGHGKNNNGTYVSNQIDWFKRPYGVRVVNAAGKKLPVKGNIPPMDSAEWFFFHMIDKRLITNFIAWSYVNKIPYYPFNFDINDKMNGQYIKMKGLLCGDILNGTPINEVDSANGNTIFTTQSLSNQPVRIQRYKGDTEDSMPTRRRIYSNDISEIYKNYGMPSDVTIDTPYALVGNEQTELTIESNNCQNSETVYGNMTVKLNNNYREGNKYTFEYGVSNGDNYEGNVFYIVDANVNHYPFSNVIIDGNEFKYDGAYGIMAYNANDLKGFINNSFQGQTTNNEEDSVDYPIGYGKDGIFTTTIKPKQFYVVVETNNKCRTISPLYDYADINITLNLVSMETLIEQEENVSYEVIKDYKFGSSLNNPIPYYFEYYPYIVNMNFYINDNIKIQDEISVETGTVDSLFDMNEATYSFLEPLFDLSIMHSYIKSRTTVSYKDCTNLWLEANIDKVDKLLLYCVTWMLSYGTDDNVQPFVLDSDGNVLKRELKLDTSVPKITIETDYTTNTSMSGELSVYCESGTRLNTILPFDVNSVEAYMPGLEFEGWKYYTIDGEKGIIDINTYNVNNGGDGSIIIKPSFKEVEIMFISNGGLWKDTNISSNRNEIVDEDFVVDTTSFIPGINTDTQKWVFDFWDFVSVPADSLSCIKVLKVCCSKNIANVGAYYKKFEITSSNYTIMDSVREFNINVKSNKNSGVIPFTYNEFTDMEIEVTEVSDGYNIKATLDSSVVTDTTWNLNLVQDETGSVLNITLNYNVTIVP